MKKWISTLLFLFCTTFSIPAILITNHLIHDFYFEKYNAAGLWDVYYSEMENMQLTAVRIIGAVCFAVYVIFVISSAKQMNAKNIKTVLIQAAIVQTTVLASNVVLMLFSVIASFVSIFNMLVALFTLPIIYISLFSVGALLYVAGVLRGIAGVISMRHAYSMSTSRTVIHVILQFIPAISIIDCIFLVLCSPQ